MKPLIVSRSRLPLIVVPVTVSDIGRLECLVRSVVSIRVWALIAGLSVRQLARIGPLRATALAPLKVRKLSPQLFLRHMFFPTRTFPCVVVVRLSMTAIGAETISV